MEKLSNRFVGNQKGKTPLRLAFALLTMVCAIEFLIMAGLHTLGLPPWLEMLMDALLLTTLMVPGIYWFVARPYRKQLAQSLTMQEKLAEQNLFIADIIEAIPSPFSVVDTDTYQVLMANQAAKGENYFPGITCHALSHHTEEPCDSPEHHFPLAEIRKTGKPVRMEHIHFDREGNEQFVEVHGYPITDASGRVSRMIEFCLDVTERKKIRLQLEKVVTALEKSNKELQDFAYIASHDLQEPLRKVTAFGDRLQTKYGDVLGERGGDYLQRMRSSATRMQDLITDLLDFSRVTTKGNPFVETDLEKIVQGLISDFEVHLEEKDASISSDGLPSVECDPLQMRQLLQNLIGNALKFTAEGVPPRIQISHQRFQDLQDGMFRTFYGIRVRDNGIGFDEKYLDRIFGVFQRLHGRDEYQGTGVGLAICRKIVERHDGTLTASSTPGQGAEFVFTLPIKQDVQEEVL